MVFPSVSEVELFAVASIALLLIPGPAVLYVVTQSAEQGRSAGLASVAGIHIGTFVHCWNAIPKTRRSRAARRSAGCSRAVRS